MIKLVTIIEVKISTTALIHMKLDLKLTMDWLIIYLINVDT